MVAERHAVRARITQMTTRLSLLSVAICAALPLFAFGQAAQPIAGTSAPLYPASPGSTTQGPTLLRGEAAGDFALNRVVNRLVVEVDRDAVPADGQTPTQVTVRLFDASGNPLTSAAFVTIEASGGRVLLPGARTDEQGPRGLDADKVVPGVQLRVENGVAQFSLLAPMLAWYFFLGKKQAWGIGAAVGVQILICVLIYTLGRRVCFDRRTGKPLCY